MVACDFDEGDGFVQMPKPAKTAPNKSVLDTEEAVKAEEEE
jgi:hypothetical protein